MIIKGFCFKCKQKVDFTVYNIIDGTTIRAEGYDALGHHISTFLSKRQVELLLIE